MRLVTPASDVGEIVGVKPRGAVLDVETPTPHGSVLLHTPTSPLSLSHRGTIPDMIGESSPMI